MLGTLAKSIALLNEGGVPISFPTLFSKSLPISLLSKI